MTWKKTWFNYLLWAIFVVPETKGKQLEEMRDVFKK